MSPVELSIFVSCVASEASMELCHIIVGFYPTALKGCWGIFTHGVWMGKRVFGRVGGRRE